MPVAGLVRLRKHQFGRQASHGTKVPATRAYGFRGVPSVDLAWTDPEIDAGSLDPTAAPFRGAPALSADLTHNALTYNDLTAILAGFLGGGEVATVSGTACTWSHAPSSTVLEELDRFTYEFGDDVLDDWYQFGDGIVESFEISGPEGLGPLTASVNWKFGSVSSTGSTDSPVTGTVPTPALSVEKDGVKLYLKDGGIAIASDPGDLDTSAITDALHAFTFRASGDIDEKRYANADQSFDVDDYARASRLFELEATFAKTDDIVGTGSESDAWMSDEAVTRYVRLTFESRAEADYETPYSWVVTMPMRYYTRTEGESGGNSTVVLTARAFFDPDEFDGVLTSVLVNTLAAL